MGLQTLQPPPRGTYVEICKGHYRIIARVIWSEGQKFGVETQDSVDIDAIAAPGTGNGQRPDGSAEIHPPSAKWKVAPKRPAELAERSRFVARSAEFMSFGFLAAVAAACLFAGLQQTFHKPLAQFLMAMGTST